MEGAPLLKSNYNPETEVFSIKRPEIKSGPTYYFESDSGLSYQVTFGKRKKNYLGNIINFSVISEDYEDEYSVTNRGEVWKIINTMTEVIRIYHEQHPYSNTYEFTGEIKEGEMDSDPSIRTRLYLRAIEKNVDLRYWDVIKTDNKVILTRR